MRYAGSIFILSQIESAFSFVQKMEFEYMFYFYKQNHCKGVIKVWDYTANAYQH